MTYGDTDSTFGIRCKTAIGHWNLDIIASDTRDADRSGMQNRNRILESEKIADSGSDQSNHAVIEEIKTQHNDECRPAKLGLRSGTYPGEVVAYMYTWLRTWYNSTWLIT